MLTLQSKIWSSITAVVRWVGITTIFALDFVGKLFEEYKAARRLLLIWAVVMITYTINLFWANISKFPQPSTVVVAILGLLTVVLGFYQWSRGRDE